MTYSHCKVCTHNAFVAHGTKELMGRKPRDILCRTISGLILGRRLGVFETI